jgi:gamma-glutamylcyclotransferase (GGCT)/AIG2-like uncharacterized protein YtfP
MERSVGCRGGGSLRLAVYGTLRAGQPNHDMLRGARLLGSCRTTPRYTMLDLGAFPGAVSPGRTALVVEVYRISRDKLASVDRLEDCPRLYRRVAVATPWGRAWMYLYRGAVRGPAISGGDWVAWVCRFARNSVPR